MKKVILLFGGKSLEHDVSISSAKSILENINLKKWQVEPIYIDKMGDWFLYKGEVQSLPNIEVEDLEKVYNIVDTLKKCDIVFPMFHGTFGEDGRIQSLLELFDIPYVGCDSKTSMICMDKDYMKIMAANEGIAILPYKVLTKENKKEINDFPVIVKPNNGGSSIGIGIANNKRELSKYFNKAKMIDNKVIVEKYAMVRELEVGILTTKKGIIMSGIGEILKDSDCYSYDKKYVNSNETSVDVNLSKEVETEIKELVKKIVNIFNLQGLSRIDFFYEENTGMIYFNEVNTIPGFTEISMYPKLFLKCNISYQKLLDILLMRY